jgi:hypothetical protein
MKLKMLLVWNPKLKAFSIVLFYKTKYEDSIEKDKKNS